MIPTTQLTAEFSPPTAVDILPYLRDTGFRTIRGTTTSIVAGLVAQTGQFTFDLDNRARLFDPNYAAGAYYGQVGPGVIVNLRATVFPSGGGSVNYPIFAGWTDDFVQTYPSNGNDQIASVTAYDTIAKLGGAGFAIARSAESAHDRITAIVGSIAFLYSHTYDTGTYTVGPLKFSSVSIQSGLQDIADIEYGQLYDDIGGLTFRDHTSIETDTRSTVSQATFTDTGAYVSGNIQYTDVTMVRTPIINDVTVVWNDEGDTVRYTDAGAYAAPWGYVSQSYTLPFNSAADATAWAVYIVNLYKAPKTVFQQVTFHPSDSRIIDGYVHALGREIGDRVTVTRTPKVNGVASAPITADMWITGIEHNYKNNDWATTFYLTPVY